MKDETYCYIQDVKEKKITARSARNARTHAGKSGRVKLPCDYMTQKELKALNGECKTYRLNEPMSWAEFKALPDDIKVTYIKLLREKFDVPDKEIADMFGADRQTIGRWFRCLGLGVGKINGGRKKWNEDGWYKWRSGDKSKTTEAQAIQAEEIPVTDPEPVLIVPDGIGYVPLDEVPVTERECSEENKEPKAIPENHFAASGKMVAVGKMVERKPAIPVRGELTFCGMADDVLKTISVLLGGGKRSDKSFVGGHCR